jgi:hypothetical protein
MMASGEMDGEQFTAFLSDAFANLAGFSIDGSIHFVCMDWRHLQEVMAAGRANFTELKNLIVWAKDNGAMARRALSWRRSTRRPLRWHAKPRRCRARRNLKVGQGNSSKVPRTFRL